MRYIVLTLFALVSQMAIGFNLTVTKAAGDNLTLSVSVILEGCFNGTSMLNMLQQKNLLDRYKYDPTAPTLDIGGMRSLRMNIGTNIPTGSVDVIKILLRQPNAPYRVVDSVAAWIINDGSIRDFATGINSQVVFPVALAGTYYVEIRHRNHLAVVSNALVDFASNRLVSMDFKNPKNLRGKVNSYKLASGGIAALMVAGDVYKDKDAKETNAHDLYNVLAAVRKALETTLVIYDANDVNMDGTVNENDLKLAKANADQLYFFPLPVD